MIDRRLIIAQREGFHFSWMNSAFRDYYREVVVISDAAYPAREDDVLLVNAFLGDFRHLKCCQKFGILYPGFGFHPYKRPEQFQEMKVLFSEYDAIFCNDGPVWEAVKRDGTCRHFHLVPFCANSHDFKKTRKRDKFRRIIQVAARYEYKGRHVSKQAMEMMPYEWELIPEEDGEWYVPYESLPALYQGADGFIHPNMIGSPPGCYIDGKYSASTCEAGLSGCIIFWHDAMNLGNDMETVFEISLDPKEISEKVQDVVSSIDLDRHSDKTAEEFREKHGIEVVVAAHMRVMSEF